MGIDDIEPAQNGSLVIGRATAIHPVLLINGQFEGLGGPAVFLQSRLHIVVSVDENGTLVLIVAVSRHHHGWQLEVLFARLLAQWTLLDLGSKSCEFVGKELSHLERLNPEFVYLPGDSRGTHPVGSHLVPR